MMAKSDIDSDLVRKLAALLDETGLTEIEYGSADWRVRVARHPNGAAETPPAHRSAPHPSGASASEVKPADVHLPGAEPVARDIDPTNTITSPMVGTVYLARERGAEPYVRPGAMVNEGDTLLLIEAMKTFNEVKAPRAGRIAEIKVADGEPVEYGEPLLILE